MSIHDIPLSVRALFAGGPLCLRGEHLTTFSRRLKEAMSAKGHSDLDLAVLAGLSKQTVGWARRGVHVSLTTGMRLAEVAGFEWEDLATPSDRVRFQDIEGRWWLLVRVADGEEAV